MNPNNKNNNGVLLVVLALVCVFALGCVIGLLTSAPSAAPPYSPTASQHFVQLKPESSEEFFREGRLSADGQHLLLLIVNYRDGRRAEFSYGTDGKVTTVRVYNAAATAAPSWQGWYDASGRRLVRVEEHRDDGTLWQTRVINADSTVKMVLRGDGSVESRETTLADGSRITYAYNTDGTTALVSLVQPVAHDIAAGQSDGDTTPAKFNIHMVGAVMRSWDYRDSTGEYTHHAEVAANGDLTISVYRNGALQMVQHWQVQGEDNLRKYYALVSTDQYYDGGTALYRQLFFWPNQKTVRQSRLYRQDGTTLSVRYYDRDGYSIKSDEFDESGRYVETRPAPTWYKSSEWVSRSLTDEPGTVDGEPAVYRLRGKAFSKPTLDGKVDLDPLFR